MNAANRLFADPYGLPKSQYLLDSENTPGLWQACELDTMQPEPGKVKNSVFAVMNPDVIGKSAPKKEASRKAVAPKKASTGRGAKAVNSKLNDKLPHQGGKKACLLGQGCELIDGEPLQAWHATQEPKPESCETAKRTPSPHMTTRKTALASEASKRANAQPVQTSLEFEVIYPNGLTPRQAKEVEAVAKHRYTFPRVFVLLVQVAHLTDLQVRYAMYAPDQGRDEIVKTVTTEQLLKRSKQPNAEVRRALQTNLELISAMGLLEMDSEQTRDNKDACWKLTGEGKRFMMAGIKARKMLRKSNGCYTDEEQCAQISADELEDWRLEAEDRTVSLAAHLDHDERGRKAKIKTLVSREDLALAIEQRAKKRVQASEVNNLWCGLVR